MSQTLSWVGTAKTELAEIRLEGFWLPLQDLASRRFWRPRGGQGEMLHPSCEIRTACEEGRLLFFVIDLHALAD